MEITLPFRRLVQSLVSVWVFLVIAGFCVEAWKYILYLDDSMDWLYFFGLSYEQNLPTWYSSSLLLLCAVQLALAALVATKQRTPFRMHWWSLSLIFFYISLDEAATIHEGLSRLFDFGGVLYFGWVVPAAIAVLALGLIYLPFLKHLDSSTRWNFVRAGCFYVGGALGVELLLGYWTDMHGTKNLGYGLIDLLEESMEILGVSLFFVALLEFLAAESRTIRIYVTS